MRFLEELLFLSFLSGIGKGVINKNYIPWRYRTYEKSSGVRCPEEGAFRKDKTAGASVRLEHQLEFPGGSLKTVLLPAEEWLQQMGRLPQPPEKASAMRKTKEVLQWLDKHEEVRVCTVFDEEYPLQLEVMDHQKPLVLYITGSAAGLMNGALPSGNHHRNVLPLSPSLAVIGSRWPGDEALRNGPSFTRKLVRQSNMTITSGLARGCDRMGHQAAIESGVATIAVMPCGPDLIVPEANQDLAAQIAGGKGLLITEYPPGTPPAEYRYAERDRVVAALSSAAVVIECGIRSGTMQTVRAARSFGKPMACWYPEGAERFGFEGNLYMMDHMGAFRLDDGDSVVSFLRVVKQSEKRKVRRTEQLSFL